MPQPRRSGLNVSRVRRADGSVVEYFYDRRTKAFLGHDRAAAEARVAEVPTAGLPAGSFAALIVEYLGSPEYQKLRPSTRKLYRGYLDELRRNYGDLPIRGIRPSTIQQVKRSLRATPSKANMVLALFRILLGHAVRLDQLRDNPALRPGRLETPPRTEIWSQEDELRFQEAATPPVRLAFMLMLYTLQRPSDVLEMGPDRVSDRGGRLYIALRQGKTGELLDVPVHARLAAPVRARLAELEAEREGRLRAGLPGRAQYLVASPTGLLWRRRNMSRAWDEVVRRMNLRLARRMLRAGMTKAQVRAELQERHRQRRDLRRTGIVRLAEAGATTAQIAAVSGHSIDYCQRIIDTYLPRRTEVALSGIELWEERQQADSSKVVKLAAKRRT